MSRDYIVRATAASGAIRAFAITSRDTVEEARFRHNSSPVVTAALGRLLSAAAMMGVMMKNEKDTLTLQVRGSGPMKGMTAIADARGWVKGYAIEPNVIIPANDKGKLDVATAVGVGVMNVIKDMGLKEPYMGSTHLVSSEIAEDLTYYFAASEQVPSAVGLGVLMEKNNTVKQAGGFIIQLMPFAEEEVIEKLEKRLAEVTSVTEMLDNGMTPEMILEQLLGDMDLVINEKTTTRFWCDCSKEKVSKAIASIGRADLEELIAENEPVTAKCDFCDTDYIFEINELEEILKNGERS